MRFMYFQISHIKNEADYYHQYFEKGALFFEFDSFFQISLSTLSRPERCA